jgi:hypothetical protein
VGVAKFDKPDGATAKYNGLRLAHFCSPYLFGQTKFTAKVLWGSRT